MNKVIQTPAVLLTMLASLNAQAENTHYLEFSSVLREHNYDFDIRDGANRYFIDERFRTGFSIEGGWSLAPTWTVVANYEKHDTDNADGVILVEPARVQAPIFYVFQRASLGVKKNWAIGENLWLDTTMSFQRTEQGVGNFFIQSGDLAFGLNTVEKSNGVAAEVALRKPVGNWEFQLLGGFDPHAGFEIGASDINVESSSYGGAGASYHLGERFKLGVSATLGKASDLEFSVGVKF